MEQGKNINSFQSRQKMKFTKTETEYSMKSIRFLLLTITSMFIIIAGLMIVLGISVYSRYHSYSFFYESAKSARFFTPSVLSVFVGMVLLIVTSFGFFGSLKQSTCMVNLYALILALILIVKLVVVVMAFTMSTATMMQYIDIPIMGYTSDPEIRDEIDKMQVALNCCGSSSFMDYLYMDFPDDYAVVTVVIFLEIIKTLKLINSETRERIGYTTTVNKEIDGDLQSITVPESCCATAGDIICTKIRNTGCKDALVNLVVQNSGVLGVLGVSVMFIQLLGIIFALLLARCIRKLKSEKALMTWKIKEQMILAREDNKNHVYIAQADSSVA